MADVNALTYLTLQNAVLGKRFPAASMRPDAKRWLATAYQDVWSAEDWVFKRVLLEDWVLDGTTNAPPMAAIFGEVIDVFDAGGRRLEFLAQERFERRFESLLMTGVVANPSSYTSVNGQVYLDAIPPASTFKISYYRRLASRRSDLSVQYGFMSADTDYPLWDDHNSVLIPRAMAIGLIEINDIFSWEQSLEEYGRQLDRMKSDLAQTKPAYQWSSSQWTPWGAGY